MGRVAARQYGLIGRAQALEAGLSVAAIDWHVRSGEWERLHPSVYRLRGAPARWPQPLMAAILWGGPRAVVSHRSAAALWELDGIEPGVVELTTTGSRSDTPPGVILHRTRTLPRSSFGYLGAFRVTGVVRTLIDLGAVVDAAAVEAAMESAIRRRPEMLAGLQDALADVGRKGRGGVGALRVILARRNPAAAPTEGVFETLLLRALIRARLPLPVRQYEVRDGDQVLARIDFAWPDRQVGLEADGYWCHSGRARWQRDLERGNALSVLRWQMLHVSWDDLHERPDHVAMLVRRALDGS